MPFHTWIPDTAKYAPVPVVAFLPASVDKLLGIYLLARVVKDMFILDIVGQSVLLILGGLTVICAVMMALVQHDIKKLLGYHAVSQVGYMVLGIGCGNPVGIAGGLFHMVNHAIYKSCLFLGAGNVEKKAGTSNIEELGGLAKFMPVTFVSTLIAALSISGIPPLNGFVSKWMVYQGAVDLVNKTPVLTLKIIAVLSLTLALIGSGLTLASFIKLISGTFLGNIRKQVTEVNFLLYAPQVILALLCVIFGVFFYPLVFPFITKVTGFVRFTGIWQPAVSTGLIIAGIILGLIFFKVASAKPRTCPVFTGGRGYDPEEEARVEDFYEEFKDLPVLKRIYELAEKKVFDIYEQGLRFVFFVIKGLRYLHNGVLPTYLVWCILGMMGLIFVFFR